MHRRESRLSARPDGFATSTGYRARVRRLTGNSRAPFAASTAANLVAYLLIAKYVAESAGVAGIAVLGVVSAIANDMALVGDANVGIEMSRRVAENIGSSDDLALRRQVISAARRITVATSGIIFVALTIMSGWLSGQLGLRWYEVVLASSAGAATIAAQQEFNVLSGLGRSRAVAAGVSVRSFVVLVSLVATILAGGSIPVAYTVGTEFKPAARRPIEKITYWNGWKQTT